MDEDKDYEVGYGKPPRATRFRKGHSGNPKGRPRQARGVRTLLETALSKKITINEAGRKSQVSKSEALILSLITKAIKGDIRAAAQVLRLMEEQEIVHQQDEGITINVIDRFDHPE
ncbi:hypothetical protein C1J02_16085 [Sulfitobacter sp. SK011]|nr:hypothetical protein C1J02_16085 [Sulfitobacter sp. SK011]